MLVNIMKYGVETRQGRLIIPADWRKNELEGNEVFIIKEKGELRIIPKKRRDLKKFFDSVDLGTNIDEDEFERDFYEVS
ncbi:MAG: AbrB family transcriptional regulator [Archaeoglobales archaeon]|nr:MAG: AbrB family transcriptional regulator [Archaeoglobales archaeon]